MKETVDKGKPENKKPKDHAKRKWRSFLEFSEDPASIESKAGRVANDAGNVQLATCKG